MIDPETLADFKNGFDDESYLVAAIKKHLRTSAQKIWLDDHDISIEDLLNGRVEGDLMNEVRDIFDDWNKKLGFHSFGF
jgi:hypothetical protein